MVHHLGWSRDRNSHHLVLGLCDVVVLDDDLFRCWRCRFHNWHICCRLLVPSEDQEDSQQKPYITAPRTGRSQVRVWMSPRQASADESTRTRGRGPLHRRFSILSPRQRRSAPCGCSPCPRRQRPHPQSKSNGKLALKSGTAGRMAECARGIFSSFLGKTVLENLR